MSEIVSLKYFSSAGEALPDSILRMPGEAGMTAEDEARPRPLVMPGGGRVPMT